MAQVTWRASEEQIARVRRAAERQGWSMNEYVTVILDVATNPELGGSEAERLRDRLANAGLLAPRGTSRKRPPADRVRRARQAAGKGKPLSQVVAEDR